MATTATLNPVTRRRIAAAVQTLPLGRSREMGIVKSIPCAKSSRAVGQISGENYGVRSTGFEPNALRDHEVLLSIARFVSSQNSAGQARPLLTLRLP